jgi:hypothetical protein
MIWVRASGITWPVARTNWSSSDCEAQKAKAANPADKMEIIGQLLCWSA